MAPAQPTGPHVIVVGAGVVGLATAYYLQLEGATVELVDSGTPPTATSRASLGILTHPNGDDGAYSQLYRDGHAAYGPLSDRLRQDTSIDIGWRTPGGIDLIFDDADEARIEDLVRRNNDRGCPSQHLSSTEIQRRVPAASPGIRGGLFFPDDHRVDPVALSRALIAALKNSGARLHWGQETLSCTTSGAGVAVKTPDQILAGDVAVLAAGAWTAGLCQQLEAQVPVRPVRGQHCRFAGGDELPHILRYGGNYLVADGQQIVAGATVEDIGFETGTSDEGAAQMRDFFRQLLTLDPRVLDQRAGLRPKPKGGRPLLGPLRHQQQIYAATGHYKNGVLLAAVTGQILSRWITTGDPGRDMSYFTPER
jgi:glycine oxidase